LLAVIITLSLVFRINNFIPILVNGILTLYATLPVWGYCLFDVPKKYFKNIPLLVVTEAVIDNILIAHNKLPILYILRIVFYVLFSIPIFIKKGNKYEKNSPEGKMQKATKITNTLFAVFFASLIPFSRQIFVVSFVSSLFWAGFTLSYQIPGIVYCISRSAKKETLFGSAGIQSLTKRENEVALAICSGLKYEEIAGKLFISLSAVKKHSFFIYKKLGIKNNRELMQLFMETQKNNAPNEPIS
jgi:DNA-binding CsgD family transcriptional regulator